MSTRNSSRILLSTIFLSMFIFTGGCAFDSGSGSDSGDEMPVLEGSLPGSEEDSAEAYAFCGTADLGIERMTSLSALYTDFTLSGALARTKAAAVSRGPVNIPVVFHVISKGAAFEEGEVPDAMLIQQVDVLNRAFSGEQGGVATPFRFHLAGINRVRKPEWHVLSPGSTAEQAAKEELKQGGADTLNFYLADIQVSLDIGGGRGKVLGYTSLPVFYFLIPRQDGIVMNFASIAGGPLDHYNLGHVAVHETGHWLGLLHTFTGECDGFFDDLVGDTPREKMPEKGDFCPLGRDSCPAQEGIDPIHNQMTYTGDECRSEFTSGQLDFMLFTASFFRSMQGL